jgi:hypothetical protein
MTASNNQKISEILWKGANEHLWDGEGDDDPWSPSCRISQFSCHAVKYALGGKYPGGYRDPTNLYLQTLGLMPHNTFVEFPSGPIRQGARYLFLDFARLVAEDEGL